MTLYWSYTCLPGIYIFLVGVLPRGSWFLTWDAHTHLTVVQLEITMAPRFAGSGASKLSIYTVKLNLWPYAARQVFWATDLFLWAYVFIFFLFWGHNKLCSGLTLGSVPRDHSWWALGTILNTRGRICIVCVQGKYLNCCTITWAPECSFSTKPQSWLTFESYLTVLRVYTWFCVHGSLLALECQGLNLGWLLARQASCPLCYLMGPIFEVSSQESTLDVMFPNQDPC